jgi:hypothetical protein
MIYKSNIKLKKENARVDILSKKLGYEKKQKQPYPKQTIVSLYNTCRS